MSRISIDVTTEQHQRLKAMAALQGMSIKQFVLASTLGEEAGGPVERGLAELEAILDQRLAEARAKGTSKRTATGIFQQARDAPNGEPGE